MNNTIYSNGIRVDGSYAIPPLSVEELNAIILGQPAPENIGELNARATVPKHWGVGEGVDPKKLEEAGWGVIFADDANPEIEKALEPLISMRSQKAGALFQRYSGDKGFRVSKDDTKSAFLARNGVGPGPAIPEQVPYYLLIVGSPEKIPFEFQAQLDVQYAVGRIHFDTPADYAVYAESVVAAEEGRVKLPRQASFFGVSHEIPGLPGTWETTTRQSLEYLIDPLVKNLGSVEGWRLNSAREAGASKQELKRLLGGSNTPALLFTASHGLDVTDSTDPRMPLAGYQGALVCADWQTGQRIDPDVCFAGADLANRKDANLLGLISFFFACFGGGTPQMDIYTRLLRKQRGLELGPASQLAAQPFVADLPRRMLSAPGGGGLAVIGHVERCWPSSFLWLAKEDGTLPPQTEVFESTLKRLMSGYPVGAAVEYLNQRYAELAGELNNLREESGFEGFKRGQELANTWMAASDAEWYTIFGDPAVRLPVVEDAQVEPRPVKIIATAMNASATSPAQPDEGRVAATADSPAEATPKPNSQQSSKVDSGSTSATSDPRFAHSYTVAPAPTKELAELKYQHPELYKAYVDHVTEGYKNNGRIFDDVRRAFMRSHNSTVVMYWILFTVGVGTVLAGIVMAVLGQEVVAGAVFLGLGVVAFITYFISRPTQSVEENLMYITWLGVIYNSYWTHLAWATQRDTAQAELDRATTDALQQLEKLVERHALSVKGRPTFGRKAAQAPAAVSEATAGTVAPRSSDTK